MNDDVGKYLRRLSIRPILDELPGGCSHDVYAACSGIVILLYYRDNQTTRQQSRLRRDGQP